MADYLWSGDEDVQCEIEIEQIGDRRKSHIFKATVRRIQHDGLLPLSYGDGRPAEWVETNQLDALARAQLFIHRRFGFGTLSEATDATSGMRLFTLQQPPDDLVIAAYGRYGCPVCKIGEPDEEKLDHWLEHAQREHGYEVTSDRREPAPGLPDTGRRFRVIRLRRRPAIRQTVSAPEPEVTPEPDVKGAAENPPPER